MVFGTYDIFHKGHQKFFQQAKRLGNYLIVVVARDLHVKAAKSNFPINKEVQRSKIVRRTKLADKVILGSKTHNFYRTIRTYQPAIIALGYDQKPSLRELRKDLKRHRLAKIELVRLRSYQPEIYKSSKLKAEPK